MRRRDFLGMVGAAAWPLVARAAGRDRTALVGYLNPLSPGAPELEEFRAGLRELGYVEGENLLIETRFAEGRADRLPALAAELVALNVDVILTVAGGVYAAKAVTSTVPIVMAAAADVVAMGLAASLAHPGGNVTGLTFLVPEIMAKRLAFLKEAAPSMSRAGLLLMRDSPSNANVLAVVGAAAEALKVELRPIEVGDAGELETAILAAADAPTGGLVSTDQALFLGNAAAIADIAGRRRLASIGGPLLAAKGGLLGYGVEFPPMFRHAAAFVAKILEGEKPGEIPIEQATKFRMIVNLKTAKALGLEIPTTVLAGADEVIE